MSSFGLSYASCSRRSRLILQVNSNIYPEICQRVPRRQISEDAPLLEIVATSRVPVEKFAALPGRLQEPPVLEDPSSP